jgi:hypothetical protein
VCLLVVCGVMRERQREGDAWQRGAGACLTQGAVVWKVA